MERNRRFYFSNDEKPGYFINAMSVKYKQISLTPSLIHILSLVPMLKRYKMQERSLRYVDLLLRPAMYAMVSFAARFAINILRTTLLQFLVKELLLLSALNSNLVTYSSRNSTARKFLGLVKYRWI